MIGLCVDTGLHYIQSFYVTQEWIRLSGLSQSDGMCEHGLGQRSLQVYLVTAFVGNAEVAIDLS